MAQFAVSYNEVTKQESERDKREYASKSEWRSCHMFAWSTTNVTKQKCRFRGLWYFKFCLFRASVSQCGNGRSQWREVLMRKGTTVQQLVSDIPVIVHILRCWLNMLNKQITVKQQENTLSNIWRSKKQKPELCQFCAKILICTDLETEHNISVRQYCYSTYGVNSLCQN
jgi:hypothetical protein